MSELLTTVMSRYLRDRAGFPATCVDPVLLVSPERPPSGGPASRDDLRYRLQTASGVGLPILGGSESIVFPVRKTRENAFPRGVTIGRTGNNDAVLDDPSVSRFHAWIARDPQAPSTWQLVDAGSHNGTLLEGVALTPKKPVTLQNGARLTVGRIKLTFLLPEGLLDLLRGPGSSAS